MRVTPVLYLAIEAALRAGDLSTVRDLFSGEPGFPNVSDPLTWTPLLSLAISSSPPTLVRELLDAGASPNYETTDGCPAVYAALSSDRADRYELIELLLERGADPDARGINDYTPLHLAVAQRDERAMRLLLAHGADARLRTRIDECADPVEEGERMGNPEGAAMLRRLLAEMGT